MGSENEMIKMSSLHCFYQTCSVISMRNIRAEWEGQRHTLACVHGGGASAKETHPDDTTSTPSREPTRAEDERNKQPSLRLVCVAAVLFGTLSIVCVKATFNTTCADGHKFNAPFLMCIVVAAAMATPLVAFTAFRRLQAALRCASNFTNIGAGHNGNVPVTAEEGKKNADADRPLLGDTSALLGDTSALAGPAVLKPMQWQLQFCRYCRDPRWVAIPLAVSDLLVSICDNVSVQLAPVSITSMVNCSILGFCAIASRCILQRKYHPRQWLGIAISMIGVVVVGAATWIPSEKASNGGAARVADAGPHALLGVLIALLARLLQSVQFVFEEKWMQERLFTPTEQVGLEGCVELVLLATVVLPLVQHVPGSDRGHGEDVSGAVRQVLETPALAMPILGAYVGLCGLNLMSMTIGKRGGSVLRVFLDVVRAGVVWAAELAMGAVARGSSYGEVWTFPGSWMEMAGFALVPFGFWLYFSFWRAELEYTRTLVRDGLLPAGRLVYG